MNLRSTDTDSVGPLACFKTDTPKGADGATVHLARYHHGHSRWMANCQRLVANHSGRDIWSGQLIHGAAQPDCAACAPA